LNAAVVLSVAAVATDLVVMALLWTLGGFQGFRRVRWFAGLAASAAVFSVTNLAFSVPNTAPALVVLAAQLGSVCAASAAVCWLCYTRVRRGLPALGGVDTAVVVAAVVAGLLSATPGLVYRDALLTVPVPWLGLSYRIPEPTVLAMPVYLAMIVPLWASARHLRNVGSRVGQVLHLVALVSVLLAGVNEALVSAGVIQSPYLLELTYALTMLAVGYEALGTFAQRSRQLAELSDSLQEEIALRSRELLAVEQQAARDRQLAGLGRLAAGVAHEINNPLSYVQSSLDFVGAKLVEANRRDLLGADGAVMVEALGDALDGTTRITRVVRDLRVMTPSAGHGEGPAALAAATERAVKLCAHVVRDRGVSIDVDVPSDLWLACADQPLVRALSNLLTNAAQAADPGRPNRITVRAVSRELQRVEISVADTGRGIDAEQRAQIFEPFFSGRPGEGMGLGLAITHALVRSLDGEITVESELGVGTTFHLLLPQAATATQTTEVDMDIPEVTRPQRALRIVLIDDEPLVARSLARLLHDHEVEIFNDPQQARDRLLDPSQPSIDAVLCDKHMGCCSGPELQAMVAEVDRELAKRFIFISGDTFDELDTELAEDVPFIAKPIDLGLLQDALDRVPRAAAAGGSALKRALA
jgi:signal transduction histidine kinase